MGLCQKVFGCAVFFATVSFHSAAQKPAPQMQADVCEMLRHTDEEVKELYPNEYYDCHAHSRYIKVGSLETQSAHRQG